MAVLTTTRSRVEASQPGRTAAGPTASSEEEDEGLGQDYTELAGLIARGEFWQLNARRGNWLQIRPKGAKRSDRVMGYGPEGTIVPLQPRGFYLRSRFTKKLIKRALDLP